MPMMGSSWLLMGLALAGTLIFYLLTALIIA